MNRNSGKHNRAGSGQQRRRSSASVAEGYGGSRFIGLDVHKREVTATAVDAEGRRLWRERFELDRGRLDQFIQQRLQPGDEVALEVTTNCWAVAEPLCGRVARVVVSNPMATKAIAQAKIKTDKVDSEVLAQLLRCDYLPEVWQPDTETQHRRQLAARRTGLVQQRTAVRNRIHSVLAMRLISTPSELFGRSGREWLEELLEDEALDETARLLIRSDLSLHEALEQQIAALEDHLARLAWEEEQVKLLMTLPGVDVAVAWTLLAAIGEVGRFRSPQKLAGYLGLVPSTRQSAARCYHGPITKAGNSMARWMLIQAAQHAGRHPGPLGHFFNRLKRRKNHNIAVVATARKLAMIAWHMLTHNEPYRYAVPRSTGEKLARLRVRATGEKRKSGSARGVKSEAKLPGGSRTIRSLDGVYENEGLPARQQLSQGERRHLRQTGTAGYAAQLATEQIVPRLSTPPESGSKTNTSQGECEAVRPGAKESMEERSAATGRQKRAKSDRGAPKEGDIR